MTPAELTSPLAVLQALTSLTPSAPGGDVDASDVIAQARVLFEARAPYIERLKVLLDGGAPFGAEEADARDALCRRDADWEAALTRARYRLRERRVSTSRLRHRGYTR